MVVDKKSNLFWFRVVWLLRNLIVILMIVHPVGAQSAPVFIQAGHQQGQGYAFNFHRNCYAITAAHNVKNGKSVGVFGTKGQYFEANVLKLDIDDDLALLQLLGNNGPVGSNELDVCSIGNGIGSTATIHPLDIVNPDNRPSIAWLYRIASPAGGIERVYVSENYKQTDTDVVVNMLSGMQFYTGDSGGSVWLKIAPNTGYTKEQMLNSLVSRGNNGRLFSSALFLGILTSNANDKGFLVRPDIVRNFVLGYFDPINWNDIKSIPESLDTTRRVRGTLDSSGARISRHGGFISHDDIYRVSYEFGLGSKDTIVEGIAVEYESDPKSHVDLNGYRRSDLRLFTSQFRRDKFVGRFDSRVPEFTEIEYVKSFATRSNNNLYQLKCDAAEKRIARAVQVTVVGEVGSLRSIQILSR